MLYSRGGGIAGSSNGRTLGSDPSNLGSNPSPAAYLAKAGWCGILCSNDSSEGGVDMLSLVLLLLAIPVSVPVFFIVHKIYRRMQRARFRRDRVWKRGVLRGIV